jgi:hypothetical protein
MRVKHLLPHGSCACRGLGRPCLLRDDLNPEYRDIPLSQRSALAGPPDAVASGAE